MIEQIMLASFPYLLVAMAFIAIIAFLLRKPKKVKKHPTSEECLERATNWMHYIMSAMKGIDVVKTEVMHWNQLHEVDSRIILTFSLNDKRSMIQILVGPMYESIVHLKWQSENYSIYCGGPQRCWRDCIFVEDNDQFNQQVNDVIASVKKDLKNESQ